MKLRQGLLKIPFVLTVIALSACSGPEQKIIGKWHAETKTEEAVFDFYPDGTVTMSFNGEPANAEYQFLDEDTVKIEAQGIGASLVQPVVFDVEFPSNDVMEMTLGNERESFDRVE